MGVLNLSREEIKRNLKKLYKTESKVLKRIGQLETEEVDWDEEENSAYMQEDGYKRRLMKIRRAIHKLEGSAKTTFRKRIVYQKSTHMEINDGLTHFINKSSRKIQFPDFTEILNEVTEIVKKKNINLKKNEINDEATRAFKDIGKTLHYYRVKDTEEYLDSFLPEKIEERKKDPAEEDEEMNNTLKQSEIRRKDAEQKIFEDFAQKEVKVEPNVEEKEEDDCRSDEERSDLEEDDDEVELPAVDDETTSSNSNIEDEETTSNNGDVEDEETSNNGDVEDDETSNNGDVEDEEMSNNSDIEDDSPVVRVTEVLSLNKKKTKYIKVSALKERFDGPVSPPGPPSDDDDDDDGDVVDVKSRPENLKKEASNDVEDVIVLSD